MIVTVGVTTAVAVVGAASVAESRGDAARAAAVAAVPGALEAVSGPLVPRWSVPDSELRGMTADLVVVWTPDATLALDPATGDTVWERPNASGLPWDSEQCTPLRDPDAVELEAVPRLGPVLVGPGGDAPGALVACVLEQAAARVEERTITQYVQLTLLDAEDGDRRSGWTTRGRMVLVGHLGGDDVVAAVRTPDGQLEALRWDVRTGAVRWHVLGEGEVSGPVHGSWGARLEDGVLTVEQPEAVRIDVETGAVLGGLVDDRWPAADVARALPVRDGDALVALRSGDELVGADVESGDERWRREGPAVPLAQLDGLVVLREETSTVAVDARTGRTVWTVPTARHVRFGPMLDGRVLLVPAPGHSALPGLPGARPRASLDLVAVDPSDGLERWRAALPAGTFALTATPGGHVVVQTTDGVVGLG